MGFRVSKQAGRRLVLSSNNAFSCDSSLYTVDKGQTPASTVSVSVCNCVLQGRRNVSNFGGPVIKDPHLIGFIPLYLIKQNRGGPFAPMGSDTPVLCVRRRSFIITSWFFWRRKQLAESFWAFQDKIMRAHNHCDSHLKYIGAKHAWNERSMYYYYLCMYYC